MTHLYTCGAGHSSLGAMLWSRALPAGCHVVVQGTTRWVPCCGPGHSPLGAMLWSRALIAGCHVVVQGTHRWVPCCGAECSPMGTMLWCWVRCSITQWHTGSPIWLQAAESEACWLHLVNIYRHGIRTAKYSCRTFNMSECWLLIYLTI